MEDKQILRTVNIEGELYTPGQEDEMLEHLQAQDDNVEGHDHEKELTRLERDGFIVGFIDVPEETRSNGRATSDERATRQAQVQQRKQESKPAKTKRASKAPVDNGSETE